MRSDVRWGRWGGRGWWNASWPASEGRAGRKQTSLAPTITHPKHLRVWLEPYGALNVSVMKQWR